MGYQVLDDKNIRREFFKRLDLAEAGAWASKLGLPVDSDSESETYRWLGAAPQMREWLGGRHERRLRDDAYTIRNAEYETTMELPLPMLRRDKTGQIMARLGDVATRTAQHWDKLLSDLIIAGESTACYDGQFYFDTDHVSGDSGTQTNDLTVTEVPGANVGTATLPTAAEMADIIVQIIGHMYSLKDDAGEPINQNATGWAVMVPAAGTYVSSTIAALSAQYLANGVTNVAMANPWNIQMIVNPRLTWTTKVAMFRTDGQLKPFIMQSETPVQTEFIGAGSEEAFKNNRHMFGVKASRAAGYGLWQHAALVTLS